MSMSLYLIAVLNAYRRENLYAQNIAVFARSAQPDLISTSPNVLLQNDDTKFDPTQSHCPWVWNCGALICYS